MNKSWFSGGCEQCIGIAMLQPQNQPLLATSAAQVMLDMRDADFRAIYSDILL